MKLDVIKLDGGKGGRDGDRVRCIALDDLDYDVTLTGQRLLWDGVAALAADGQPVIASTTERSVIPPEAITIDLEPEA